MFKSLFFFILVFLLGCNNSNSQVSKKSIEKEFQTSSTKNDDENIAILMDLSITMTGKDFIPNRLVAVKNAVKKIINNKKENQAFSLIVYAGKSYLICSLTKDKNKLIKEVEKTDQLWTRVQPGTNYTYAILNAINSLKKVNSKKSILMFSDGENTQEGYPIEIAIEELNQNNTILNVINIRPKEFEVIPTSADIYGELIFEKIKAKPVDKTLSNIAKDSNGFSVVVSDNKDLEAFDFQKKYAVLVFDTNNDSKKIINKNLESIYSEIELNNKNFISSDRYKSLK